MKWLKNSRKVTIPFTVGGGIATIEEMKLY